MSSLKARIIERVGKDLERIETALAENLNPYLDLVSESARHILFSGGKRLRPLLMVLSARICGYGGEKEIAYSTIFEYLHAATLLHDDLVDDASMRRGQTAAHSVYGNSTAVLVGDFLLARALTIAAGTERIEVIRTIAGITENMSQGEIHQLAKKGAIDLTEAEYMEVIENKTAVLIRGACRVGALLAGADGSDVEALSDYGHSLGIAFQMADDLLDYTADSKELGKVVGADLREGKLTLPVIRSLEGAGPEDRQRMIDIIRAEDFTDEDFTLLVQLLRKHGGISYTQAQAGQYVEKAKNALSVFLPSQERETLAMIADYALVRRS
jgi:octaprenyl-diphosphate synthase